jgi:hypothetical protein
MGRIVMHGHEYVWRDFTLLIILSEFSFVAFIIKIHSVSWHNSPSHLYIDVILSMTLAQATSPSSTGPPHEKIKL